MRRWQISRAYHDYRSCTTLDSRALVRRRPSPDVGIPSTTYPAFDSQAKSLRLAQQEVKLIANHFEERYSSFHSIQADNNHKLNATVR